MNRTLPAAALALLVGVAPPAFAGQRCLAPMTEWKPREALVEKLRAEGWTIMRIKTDHGCYKVRAADDAGHRVKAKFDPATLERLARDDDDD
ncbi:PepSY domain-containing protein [Bosea sp. 2KB_26]|uniref:PepSY domain-containing protein n=1 Tax=Bosea sp. 2KB_26 TaxID=3237475 RepID=UPI000DE5753A